MQRLSANVRHVSRRSWAFPALVQTGRRFQSTEAPLREFFVLVWDQAEANRNQRLKCDLTAPFHTFAGECLDKDRSGAQIVIGNAFACMARDTKEVETMMQSSVYNTKNIWDLKTAKISPLLTVHSSSMSSANNLQEVYEEPILKPDNRRDTPILELAF